jgi:hypothetical protein
MQVGVGSNVNVTIDVSTFFPTLNEGYAHLLALMSSGMKNAPKFDWRKRTMTIAQNENNPETEIHFDKAFGGVGAGLPTVLNITTSIVAGFSDTYGKFPVAYGNVVVMDCHYIFDNVIEGYKEYILPMKKTDPIQYYILLL